MPGRDYGQAYARLEEVLRDSSFLRSYDTAQRYTSSSAAHPALAPAADFDASLRTLNHFPPTPPPLAARKAVPGSSQQPSVVQTRQSDLSTPPALTGLPTPDVTPPVRRDQLSPFPVNGAARSNATSPFAESFRTAREDWWSANGSRISLPPDTEYENYTVQSVRSRKPSLRTPVADVALTPTVVEVAGSASPPTPSFDQPRTLERIRPFSAGSHSTPRGSMESNAYVGAVIIDNSPPARSHKLRKVSKNLDLRSVSSPLPTSQPLDDDGVANQSAHDRKRELRRMRDQSHLRSTSQTMPSELPHLHWIPDSLDRQSPETERTPRKSYDRSFKSHLGASTVSVRSDFSASTLELNEATAIQLYPRNNDSIVMVHQPVISQQRDTTAPMPAAFDSRFALGVNGPHALPRTIPYSAARDRKLDSPLTSPRAAPTPPELKVIPPSPAGTDSREASPVDKASIPRRHPSLLARARANSAPIVETLGSLKRSATGRVQRSGVTRMLSKRKQKDDGAHDSAGEYPSSQRVSSAGSSSQSKHAFREPHPFWDEELLESEFGYPSVVENARQPAASAAREGGSGNDAEDGDAALDSNWSRWKRGGSGRGFLIGNSLGIMRGPTNLRRPVFPAMKDMRPGARGQQQQQAAAASNGHPRSVSAPENHWDFLKHASPHEESRKEGSWRWWEAVKHGLRG